MTTSRKVFWLIQVLIVGVLSSAAVKNDTWNHVSSDRIEALLEIRTAALISFSDDLNHFASIVRGKTIGIGKYECAQINQCQFTTKEMKTNGFNRGIGISGNGSLIATVVKDDVDNVLELLVVNMTTQPFTKTFVGLDDLPFADLTTDLSVQVNNQGDIITLQGTPSGSSSFGTFWFRFEQSEWKLLGSYSNAKLPTYYASRTTASDPFTIASLSPDNDKMIVKFNEETGTATEYNTYKDPDSKPVADPSAMTISGDGKVLGFTEGNFIYTYYLDEDNELVDYGRVDFRRSVSAVTISLSFNGSRIVLDSPQSSYQIYDHNGIDWALLLTVPYPAEATNIYVAVDVDGTRALLSNFQFYPNYRHLLVYSTVPIPATPSSGSSKGRILSNGLSIIFGGMLAMNCFH